MKGRALSLLEIILALGFVTNILALALLSPFGAVSSPLGSVKALAVYTTLSSLLLLALLAILQRMRGEPFLSPLLGARRAWGREAARGLPWVPAIFAAAYVLKCLFRHAVPAIYSGERNVLEEMMQGPADLALFLFIALSRAIIALSLVKPYWHRLLLSLPVLGEFFRDVAVTHFCRDMGVMLQSGLPLFEALTTEAAAMENRAVAKLASSLAQAVAQGRSLSAELSRPRYALFPPLAIRMIAAGEKTGRLAETFAYLEEFYAAETDRRIKGMTVIFEPLLLVVIGLIVAFLAMAIMTPIYSLTGSIHR